MARRTATESADALRMRRVRAHKKGDHDLCGPRNCEVAMAAAAVSLTPSPPAPALSAIPDLVPNPDAGDIEVAVTAFIAALPYREGDPRKLLCLIAVKLARRIDETEAVPAAVSELRKLLMQLTEVPNGPAGPVDEIRLRAAQRQLDAIIARAA